MTLEETKNLTEAELKEMGFETRFWPWYFRIVWSVARVLLLVLLIGAALGYGTSLLSGTTYEYSRALQMALPLIAVAFLAPIIIIVVAYLWWYGSIAVDKLLGRRNREH